MVNKPSLTGVSIVSDAICVLISDKKLILLMNRERMMLYRHWNDDVADEE